VKVIKLIASLLLIVAIIALFWGIPRLAKVKAIDCANQYGPCSEMLLEKVSPLAGQTYLQVKKSLSDIIAKEKLVSDYLLQYKIGGKVNLNVIEKVARGALKIEGQENYFLVDSNGEVIAQKETTTLPVIEIGFVEVKLNDTISSQYLKAVQLLTDLNILYGVGRGIIKNEALYINLPGSVEGIFPLNKEKEVILGALKLILDRLNTEAKDIRINEVDNIKTIDLRYDNPVLR
jgi:hypothetical protein